MNRTPLALLLAACLGCLLVGCSSRTDVSATGNTPAKYSHVWITAQEVWFNTSAIAGPDDGGWVKFPLSTPTTVDLVAASGGNLTGIVSGLNLKPGTYEQIRLIPADASAALTASAITLGALFNAEADFVDSTGTTHQLQLQLLNPAQGIGIQGSLKVPVGNVGAALGSTSATSNTTTTTPFTGETAPTTTATTTPTTTTTAATTGTTTITSFAVNLDGTHDLTPFRFGEPNTSPPNGVLLSSHAAAFDLSASGAISGQLTLTNLTGISGSSGLPAIQVSAETLSADGTRHVVVNSAPVHSDGSFLIYPLLSNASTPVDYDLVIHGPGIATIIIKTIPVTLASSSTAATTTTTTAATTAGTTAATTAGTTTAATTTPSVTPVSVGTLIPRAATSYAANIVNGPAAPIPAGSQISFYQTLGSAGEVPYAIETGPIDPFNRVLADDLQLSTATIDSGTYSTSTGTVILVSAAPKEQAGRYIIAASAPSYTDGPLTTLVSSAAPTVTVPGLSLASGNTAGMISASITQATAGKYDHGELLVTHDGALVATTSIDTALTQGVGATVTVGGVPTGTSSDLYYLTVLTWNASGTLNRQSYPTALDLRSSTSGSLQLTID
jgi:hypothetical protein